MVLQFSRFLVVEVDEKRREKKKKERESERSEQARHKRYGGERRKGESDCGRKEKMKRQPCLLLFLLLALSKQWRGAKRHSRSPAPSVAPNRRHDLLVSRVAPSVVESKPEPPRGAVLS